ncbi:DUF362 domain-containing protein [Candidatus Latescibacterota bacterium]
MEDIIFSKSELKTRRSFMKKSMMGVSALSLSPLMVSGCASHSKYAAPMNQRPVVRPRGKKVSFLPCTDTREGAYQVLKPLEKEILKGIGNKQVVIKINAGMIQEKHRHESTDVEQVRGILDFLKPIHDKPVWIAEGSGGIALSMFEGYKNYGYIGIEDEYICKLVDHNDHPTAIKWIRAGHQHPRPIEIVGTYFDPNVYLISACRLKSAGGVIVTLGLKNVVMGSPVCHYKSKIRDGRNEKQFMHGGLGSARGRELSYNLFTIANAGVYPDLTVLDGVVGAHGNGPWNADPIEHGVTVASTDCIAADRLGAELMGVDYDELLYLQWCSNAGMGEDDLSKLNILGPDYRDYIQKYELNENIEIQREWIYELRKNLSS